MSCLTKPSFTVSSNNNQCSDISKWGDDFCGDYLSEIATTNPNDINNSNFNINNTNVIQDITTAAFFSYLNNGNNVDSLIESPSVQLTNLIQTCQTIPLACDRFLFYACSNCTQSQVAGNTGLTNLCGCYAYKESMSDYRNPCDATCNNNIAIQNQFDVTGIPSGCNQTVCVIDDLAIKVSGANFDINQVCSQCVGSGCSCIINLSDQLNNLDIDLGGSCVNHVCYQGNNQVTCPSNITNFSVPKQKIEQNYILTVVIGMVVVLLFLIISFFI